MSLEVILTPAEIAALPGRGHAALTGATCVVFDVLRATSSMVTALAAGRARAVYPAATIEEATAERTRRPGALLGGERHGVRIAGFQLGNSPREYADPAAVGDRDLVVTTTNGTVALRACRLAAAPVVLAGALLNVPALARFLAVRPADERLVLVCAGTHDEFSFEDALGVGALLAALGPARPGSWAGSWPDAATAAFTLFERHRSDLVGALENCVNGRRLRELGLGEDLPWCARLGTCDLVAGYASAGADAIRPLAS